ncbi:hypothetical protein [Noviherbaspirillum malthae]|uniref:hypothetical protein n=1 Tax=Noviherbaspirillum malthae TaxID=1260987 RepID=UPI00188FA210|nr:hypothetical protein [Noviherbaspirillum malthae]
MTDDDIRFRFFRDLNAEQRLAVFKAFGVYPENCTESVNHGIERRMLDAILKRKPAPAVTPERATSYRAAPHALSNYDWVPFDEQVPEQRDKDAERWRALVKYRYTAYVRWCEASKTPPASFESFADAENIIIDARIEKDR